MHDLVPGYWVVINPVPADGAEKMTFKCVNYVLGRWQILSADCPYSKKVKVFPVTLDPSTTLFVNLFVKMVSIWRSLRHDSVGLLFIIPQETRALLSSRSLSQRHLHQLNKPGFLLILRGSSTLIGHQTTQELWRSGFHNSHDYQKDPIRLPSAVELLQIHSKHLGDKGQRNIYEC